MMIDYYRIAEVFLEIRKESVLKRRQNLFEELYNSSEDAAKFLTILVSIAVALEQSIHINPKVSMNNSEIDFGVVFGNLYFLTALSDTKKLRTEFYKLPFYAQVIISFTLSKRVISQVGFDFIFERVSDIIPLHSLVEDFLIIPEDNEIEYLEKEYTFSNSTDISYPFALIPRTKAHRQSGKLYYLVNGPKGVQSNVQNGIVRKFLATKCKLTNYGVIFSMVFNKKKSRIKYVQILLLSESPKDIKNLYVGKSEDYITILSHPLEFFSEPSATIQLSHKTDRPIASYEDLLNKKGNLTTGNIIVHKNGIGILKNVPKTFKAKVLDWYLNDDYEPIGYIVDVSGISYKVRCSITNDDVEKGIDGLYLNVKVTEFLGNVVRVEYFSRLSNWYGECALCGNINTLHKNGLCWPCNSRLFKLANENTHYTFSVSVDVFKNGWEGHSDKYDIYFLNGEIVFKKNLELVRGRQTRLPYNWWDKDKWGIETFGYTED